MAYVDPRLQGMPAPVVPVEKMEREHVARKHRFSTSSLGQQIQNSIGIAFWT